MNKPRTSYFRPGMLLILLMLLSFAAPASAQTDYRVTGVTLEPAVIVSQPVKLTDNMTVRWTAPAVAGTDQILNYYLLINTTNTPLTGTALDDSTFNFKTTAAEAFHIIDKSQFDGYTGADRYLHIRTQYLTTTGIAYSDDVVVGPIRIDNVAPTGTLTLNPASGSSTNVNVESMSFTEPIKYYWLSSADTFPGGTGATYDSVLMKGGIVSLQSGAVPGNVWIYAWFEDFAGNRTTGPSASAVYNYQAPVSINHSNIFQIPIGGNLGFTVDGTTKYNWTITDPSVAGVAEISGTATDVASVTVVGKKAGSFTVTATPTTGTALKTGTITVVQTVKPGDVNGDGDITLDDVKLAFGFFLGASSTPQQFAAANVYDDSDGSTTISLRDVKGVFTLFLGGTL